MLPLRQNQQASGQGVPPALPVCGLGQRRGAVCAAIRTDACRYGSNGGTGRTAAAGALCRRTGRSRCPGVRYMDTGAGAIYAAGCVWEHTGAAGRGAAKASARAEGAVRNRYDPDLPRSR